MKISQSMYRNWVLGTLVYMVVLSLFNDYTSIIYISSASTILLASFVLQALTYWTFNFKKWLSSKFIYPNNTKFKPAKFFTLWAVLFFSKFIFLWVIDVIFRENVEISGFVSLLIIIIVMTIIKEMLYYFDNKLVHNK
jgi:uncharacterized membrane protein YvlD (DUF360 family)